VTRDGGYAGRTWGTLRPGSLDDGPLLYFGLLLSLRIDN
jgi:hypothetical protein